LKNNIFMGRDRVENVWMIRGGAFGFDFHMKFALVIVTILICFYDWKRNNRKDYWWVFLIGAILWSVTELVLQLLGVRMIHSAYLFGVEIPFIFAVILQGISEGAFVTVIGLFIGDRLLRRNWKEVVAGVGIMVAPFIISLLIYGVQIPDVGGDVPSRRLMFTPLATILLMSILVTMIIWFVKVNPTTRKRGYFLLFSMIIIGLLLNFFDYLIGTRWAEVGPISSLVRAPLLLEIAVLLYDAVIEIAVAYMLFFIIATVARLIPIQSEADILMQEIKTELSKLR